ncbi:glycosyltransferase family 4 protein [Alteromonas sp. KUL49]|uniref:glycosyltransferase family 4 protein n=1 Tax=Alteromonas sp. KUL49 TaxID=2480798 RepID=UPI00102F297C|nr:glycosyltransferase family 4 protein [Alteromonas sp. KUL49]TAP40782.1 glycosyltransferase [Alteromonas sp. KUL49]GEA10955.1 glycosyl transferase [Alteromonas sp. KUL49]
MVDKKIYLVVDSRHYAGIESHLFHLSQLIKRKKGHPILVFYKDYGEHLLRQKLKKRGIECICLKGTPMSLYQFIKSLNPRDIIHSHGYKAGILCRLFCKLTGKYCNSTYHAGDTGTGLLALYTWLDRYTAHLSTNIAVSSSINAWLGNRAKVLNNFVSPESLVNKPRNAQVNIGFVGRLSHEKGPDIFLACANRLQNFKHFTFTMFGDGPMRAELEANATDNVKFKGFCNDMENHWNELDVLMISSRQEGMPMVAIEAMMRGVTVIATPCGALPDLLSTNRGIVTSNSSVDELISALNQFIDLNQRQSDELKLHAHNYVRRFCSGEDQWSFYSKFYGLV